MILNWHKWLDNIISLHISLHLFTVWGALPTHDPANPSSASVMAGEMADISISADPAQNLETGHVGARPRTIEELEKDISYIFKRLGDYMTGDEFNTVLNPLEPQYWFPMPFVMMDRVSKTTNQTGSADLPRLAVCTPFEDEGTYPQGRIAWLDHASAVMARFYALHFKPRIVDDKTRRRTIKALDNIKHKILGDRDTLEKLLEGMEKRGSLTLFDFFDLFYADNPFMDDELEVLNKETSHELKIIDKIASLEKGRKKLMQKRIDDMGRRDKYLIIFGYASDVVERHLETIMNSLGSRGVSEILHNLLFELDNTSKHVRRDMIRSHADDNYVYNYYAVSISAWLLNFYALLFNGGGSCFALQVGKADEERKYIGELKAILEAIDARSSTPTRPGKTVRMEKMLSNKAKKAKRNFTASKQRLDEYLTDSKKAELLRMVCTKDNETNPTSIGEQKELQMLLDDFNVIRDYRIADGLLFEPVQIPPGRYKLPECFMVPIEEPVASQGIAETKKKNSARNRRREKERKAGKSVEPASSEEREAESEDSSTDEDSLELAGQPGYSEVVEDEENAEPADLDVDDESWIPISKKIRSGFAPSEGRSPDYLYDFHKNGDQEVAFSFAGSVSGWVFPNCWEEYKAHLITKAKKEDKYKQGKTEESLERGKPYHSIADMMEMFYRGKPTIEEYFIATCDPQSNYFHRCFFAPARFIHIDTRGAQHDEVGFAEMACTRSEGAHGTEYGVHHLRFRSLDKYGLKWLSCIRSQSLEKQEPRSGVEFMLFENNGKDKVNSKTFCYYGDGSNGRVVARQLTIFPLSIMSEDEKKAANITAKSVFDSNKKEHDTQSWHLWRPYTRR